MHPPVRLDVRCRYPDSDQFAVVGYRHHAICDPDGSHLRLAEGVLAISIALAIEKIG
jgi:hypothetical protein